MEFDPSVYGSAVAGLLALDGEGRRLLPLVMERPSSAEAQKRLAKLAARDLFPESVYPEAALSGLWVYFSCFDESHRLAQEIHTAEGSYWHAIIHRQEPDAGNSCYWFRQTGPHPVFAPLVEAASESGYPVKGTWDPYAFVDYCEGARRRPGSDEERIARQLQRAEWQLLFDYCARAR